MYAHVKTVLDVFSMWRRASSSQTSLLKVMNRKFENALGRNQGLV